jgi:hypothetical protein
MRKDYCHEITVGRPLAEAFPLFTPKGEEDWVPDWAPTYLRPETGDTCEEMIFTTGAGEEKTYWTCLKWQPEEGHVRYLRLTPASRVAIVDVRCTPVGDAATRVLVGYEIQSLTDAGRDYIAAMSDGDFAGMIDQWPELISAAVWS